jgi:hypothetical protein
MDFESKSPINQARFKTPSRQRGGLMYEPQHLDMKFDYNVYISKKEKREENFTKAMAKLEIDQEEKF